jgi:diaminopimelate decarboxylase
MHHFQYQDGVMFAESVDLREIAEQAGTPCYVYSKATLTRHFEAFREAFEGVSPLICYSVKANSSQAVMSLFASLGGGADIVSGGELYRALAAGVPPERIVYSGVGKNLNEFEEGLKAGISMFNMESVQELEVLNDMAAKLDVVAPVSIRVNPDVDAKTHPKITTGMETNKFGLPVEDAFEQYQEASRMSHVEIKGVSCHIGSQLTDVSPFADTLERMGDLVKRLRAEGHTVSLLDLGGGLGITYDHETPPAPKDYADALRDNLKDLNVRLILEPGRVLVGNAGILLCKVNFTKRTSLKQFFVVDAAMNDLIRPSFYDSFHAILPVTENPDAETVVADVVGPICESSDFLAKGRELPMFKRGDLMAVMSAGAYGFVMSSNYNSRPRAAEVMVDGSKWQVVRKRETYQDLIKGESIPEWI